MPKMKYFILEQEEKYNRGPNINGWYGKLDRHHLRQEGRRIGEIMILDVETDEFTMFPDILTHPCLMVSETMKRIIDLYERHLPYQNIILLEPEKKEGKMYSIPFLPEVECLTADSIFSKDRSRVKKGVVDSGMLWQRHMVEAAGIDGQCVIISLDLAEALLRGGLVGIGLKEVEIIPDKGEV